MTNLNDFLSNYPDAYYSNAPFGFAMIYRGAYWVSDDDGNTVACLCNRYDDDTWELF